MTKKTNPRKDFTQIAFNVFQQAVGEVEQEELTERQINSSKGGQKGGKVRAEKLSSEELSEVARKAARARWDNN